MGRHTPTGLKRSLTRTRSIGNRSDFSEKTNGESGFDDEDEIDDPINRYVQEQLRRINSRESHEFAEELTAQPDGAGDEL